VRRSQTHGARQDSSNRHSTETNNNETDDIPEAHDQEPYFGDLPYTVSRHCFRLASVNIDNLSQYEGKTKNPKDEHIFTSINNYELGILMMQELGLNWDAVRLEDRWQERVKANMEYQQTRSYMSHNTRDKKRQPRQWGGTGIFAQGKLSHFAMGAGSDLAGLGRWTWARFRGKEGVIFRCVSLYRPADSRRGEETVYQQHKTYFQSINNDRCPRQAFFEDLETEITAWLATGDQIVISGDINENIFSPRVTALFARHNMRNLIFDRHDPTNAPTTYYRTRSNRIVDGMWATPNIIADRCGYLEPGDFPGNHSLVWADISYVSALGHNPPNPLIPSRRRLQLWNRKCTRKYIKGYKKLERTHFLWERQVILEQGTRFNVPLTPAQAHEAAAIDDLRTISMLKAEKHCRKLFTGAVAFSQATEMPKRLIMFWELAVRRRQGIRVSKRLWRRRKTKAGLTEDTAHMSIDDMFQQIVSQ
jgi:exonuclease III